MSIGRPLNIVHVFRAPVGGLFRHVVDLARGQAEHGHRVGLIADSTTGGARAEAALTELGPHLALGLRRFAMPRHPGPADLSAVMAVSKALRDTKADVLHGHGAKGGVYARLALANAHAVRAYTPHGGSLWFEANTLTGWFYLTAEKLLKNRGNLYLFESAASATTYERKIGKPTGIERVVHNGVGPTEFEPIALAPAATDIVFLGELRALKGVDLLIDALAQLRLSGRRVTATIIGDGPDRHLLQEAAETRDLAETVQFRPPMPARDAFARGRLLVMPSRAEGFPYVVLEAAAAGKPLIATRVGGIPEIFGPQSDALVPPGNFVALAKAIARSLDGPEAAAQAAMQLRERVRGEFSLQSMVNAVLAAYEAALQGGR